MKLKGLTISQLSEALSLANMGFEDNLTFKRYPEQKGNFLHFTITVKNSANPGARRSNEGRKIAAACWHAHRDLMMEIFNINPSALLITALARYDGRQNFNDTFEDTGDQNIGSMANPLDMRYACECEE